MKIKQLPAQVANQIAAGEVIERPASVVKELLENALDAGATTIQIHIELGGVNLIKVVDDGQGIHSSDLPLAIAAHATSKLTCLNDLYHLSSMGFRGEALASIASVSKLRILSKYEDEPSAYCLEVKRGSPTIYPAARVQGTTIEVQDLFYNAPVRKKFLKSQNTEYLAIEQVVKRFAMSAPEVELTMVHNGKKMLSLSSASCFKSRVERVKKIHGKTFFDHAVFINVQRGDLSLSGWVGTPEYHRSQNDKQWIFLNRRMVKDKLLSHAIKKSYEGLLPPGRFPGCLLYLDLPAPEVDVNVHPTKHEVRFQQPRLIHDFIVSEMTKLIGQPETKMPSIDEMTYPKPTLEVREQTSPLAVFDSPDRDHNAQNLMMLNQQFAILVRQKTPYLVNLHELYRKGVLNRLKHLQLPLESRPLLVPVRFIPGHSISDFFDQSQLVLKDVGIDVDMVAENTLLIRSLPKAIPQVDIQKFMQTLFEVFSADRNTILALLARSVTPPAYPMQEEDQLEAFNFFERLAFEEDIKASWYRKLDEKTCHELIQR